MPTQRLTYQDRKQIAEMVADMLEERMKLQQILLTEEEAAAVCGTTKRTMQQMRYDGSGPPFIRLNEGPKAPIRYARHELHFWINTRQRYYSTKEALTGVDENSRHP